MNDLRNEGHGDGLAFFRDHRHELVAITHATVTFAAFGDTPYTLVLRDLNGRRMLLSGCAAGAPNSSRQTARQVLVEAGFAAHVADVVFTHAVVRLGRSCDGATWLERAMNPWTRQPSNRGSARLTPANGREVR